MPLSVKENEIILYMKYLNIFFKSYTILLSVYNVVGHIVGHIYKKIYA